MESSGPRTLTLISTRGVEARTICFGAGLGNAKAAPNRAAEQRQHRVTAGSPSGQPTSSVEHVGLKQLSKLFLLRRACKPCECHRDVEGALD